MSEADAVMDGSAGEESEPKPESPEKSSPEKSYLWGAGEIIEGKRAKKSVERLDIQVPKKTVKLSIADGCGEKLGDIPRTLHQLNKMKSADLVPLHTLLFDRRGKLSLIKKNIRQFSGFPFDSESEQFSKKREKLQKNFTNTKLKLVCEVLDLEKKGTHSDLVDRIMTFLVSPKSTGKRLPKKKKRSKKNLSGDDSKPKKSSKKRRSSSKMKPSSSPKKSKSSSKSKAIVMDSSSDEEEGEEGEEEKKKKKKRESEAEGSEAEGSESGSEAEGSESGNKEEEEEEPSEEEEEEEEEEESPKPKARAKAKKTTPAKKQKTQKKPAKKRSRKESESESSEADSEPQKKKSKPAAKTKKADSSSNSKTNNTTVDDSSDEDEPLSKMVKKPPSDEQLKETVQSLLKEANLEELTMKQICQKVFDTFSDHDLSNKKDFIKQTVKSWIT